jgi:SAM-dependent methyltransferase
MDRRERAALGALLARAGLPRGARVLDCPSGAGRLAGLLAARGLSVAAADQSEAMLAHASAALAAAGLPRRAAAADALALPFRDGAFDLVLCHRLLHHLGKEGERRALLASLAAASRRWVLLSWFDALSLQHLRRALRRPFRPSRRHAVTRASLLRDAAAAGLRPAAFLALRPWVSEVSFVLLERGSPV